MDNTREKLIELLDEETEKLKELCGGYNDGTGNTLRADHLIANGVTVQKWIPVTERLPEEDADVLCSRGNHIGALIDVYTYKGDGKWEDSYGYWNYTDIEGITHWMPLPEPPAEVSNG